ncbi:MAG TPA: porin family protein [Flavobacteriales bacterium]|nr:PorT family protein [Flavobacteriales bacterium]HQV74931.1 porin family protein [Flavobacteriales bacterium]HQW42458.1 porin family protein [Flavobacteriales bacterium]
MKKVFAIFAIALMTGTVAHGQSDNATKFRLGIKLAPNLSWIRADTKGVKSDGSKVGYTFGLMTEFPFGANGNYRFATGLMLNNIGGKVVESFAVDTLGVTTSVENSSSVNLRYIDLPLTIKLMTNEIGYMRYFGQLGFDAGVNIRAKGDAQRITTSLNRTTDQKLTDVDFKNMVSPVKLGLVIGAGFEYNFSGGTSAMVGVSYHSSFTKLLEKDFYENITGGKTYADYIELCLGVYF